MPWKVTSVKTERIEFVKQAKQKGEHFSQLCKAFGISRKTGYKWLKRFQEEGVQGLADRSRKPQQMPAKTPVAIERAVLGVRSAHPTWGGRKIYARLMNTGHTGVPKPSTITAILHRNALIAPEESEKHKAYQRFEMERPNQLWQMDFKSHFYIAGQKCCPLTVIDDHSRYLIALRVCQNQLNETVQAHLIDIFQLFGLPDAFLVDNGPPWGPANEEFYFTRLNAWLFRLDIKVIHSRPYHPQTLGKDERLHRTLKNDVLKRHNFDDFQACQNIFDTWQQIYNEERPHEALSMEVPASLYNPSQ
jgi:transposase InsO family protein